SRTELLTTLRRWGDPHPSAAFLLSPQPRPDRLLTADQFRTRFTGLMGRVSLRRSLPAGMHQPSAQSVSRVVMARSGLLSPLAAHRPAWSGNAQPCGGFRNPSLTPGYP